MFCSLGTNIITCSCIVKNICYKQASCWYSYQSSIIHIVIHCIDFHVYDHWLAIYCIIYNHYLQSRSKVCKFAGRFKYFAPSAPISLSVVGLSKTYVISKPVVDTFINHLLYTQSFTVLISMCMIIDWLYLLHNI